VSSSHSLQYAVHIQVHGHISYTKASNISAYGILSRYLLSPFPNLEKPYGRMTQCPPKSTLLSNIQYSTIYTTVQSTVHVHYMDKKWDHTSALLPVLSRRNGRTPSASRSPDLVPEATVKPQPPNPNPNSSPLLPGGMISACACERN
jgi:hypothetical protein